MDEDVRPNFIQNAEDLIYKGLTDEAAEVLKVHVSNMPVDWKPFSSTAKTYDCHFWDEEEFLSFSNHKMAESHALDKMIVWVAAPSYSKAYYLYAFTYSEQGDYQNALHSIDRGLVLEPDHPRLICEKAFVFTKTRKYQEALDLYRMAEKVRDWTPPATIAQALRGQGMVLIDLNRLEEAEAALKESLQYDPESSVAVNELAYIQKQRNIQL